MERKPLAVGLGFVMVDGVAKNFTRKQAERYGESRAASRSKRDRFTWTAIVSDNDTHYRLSFAGQRER